MAVPRVASGKTLKEDSELFFAASRAFAVPGKSPHYLLPHAFNELVRSRLRQRNRFNHDHHDTCMYIERSKNANVVAYTANLVDTATRKRVGSGIGRHCVLYGDDPIHAYFVNLEPSYVENRRRKGLQSDCDDLNIIERTLAYGCSATPVNTAGILEYWSANTLEVLESFCPEWNVGGSDDLPKKDQYSAEGDGGDADAEKVVTGDATSALPPDNASAVESLDAVLRAWWAPFNPYISHFVALPTWPGIILCLPPVAKVDFSRPSSSTAAELPTSPEVTSSQIDEATGSPTTYEKPPVMDTTNATCGNHPEPAEVTATTGVLSDEDTVVVIVARIDGELSILERVYVKSVEPKHFYNLPTVEYIEVFGVSLESGKLTYEKKLR